MTTTTPSLSQREKISQNPTAKQLFSIMDRKQTNLSVAADLIYMEDLIKLAEEVGPHICILKTHIDIVVDFDEFLLSELEELAEEHNFLLFEDRKFADIGNTVKYQYREGIYGISDWAHMVNAHTLPGPGIIEALREVGLPKGRGLLLLAELSSKGALTTPEYAEATVEMAKQYPDFVFGFISQRKLTDDPQFIHMTPGVNLGKKGDSLGQQYNTPEKVIRENGTDIIIVGRGIIEAEDPAAEALRYREAGWKAYLARG